MMEETYNGYANYETWACKLWIDNDQDTQEYYKNVTLEAYEENNYDRTESINAIKNTIEIDILENKPEVDGMYMNLLNSAIGNIDTREIAETLLNDYIER